jgi:tRNA pseudouridine synthase 10
MLGRGRPFAIQLNNTRNPLAADTDLVTLQKEINALGHGAVTVQDLQMVTRATADAIKDADATKRKTYRCVIWSRRVLQPADMALLSALRDVSLSQRTPLRVLHRRTAGTRDKTVHRVRAQLLGPHFAVMDIETSAGTYVKEFVHGDMGRTVPSVGSLLGTTADILQLDVLDVGMALPGDAAVAAAAAAAAMTEEAGEKAWPVPMPVV